MSLSGLSGIGFNERPDGGPVRWRGNGRSVRARGLYFSVKSGRHLPYESRLELHDLWRAEVDVGVVRSWPQPFTLTYADGDRLRRYTPDRKDLRTGGRIEVIEVKVDLREVSPVKARAVSEAMAARGFTYRVSDRAEIESEPTFGAVSVVQRHRRTAVTAAQAVRLQTALAGGPRPLSELLPLAGEGPEALATLCALMVRRIVAVNLENGLTAAALVRAL